MLPLLSSDFREPADTDEKDVAVTRSILAKQYVELTNTGPVWKTGLILVVYDFGFQMDSMVYGLVIGAVGSFEIAISNFYSPEIPAEEAFEKSSEIRSEIVAKAERTVRTKIGLAGLASGFLLQVFAISGPLPAELFGQNYLLDRFPSRAGFLLTLTAISLISRVSPGMLDSTQIQH